MSEIVKNTPVHVCVLVCVWVCQQCAWCIPFVSKHTAQHYCLELWSKGTVTQSSIVQAVPALQGPVTGVCAHSLQVVDDLQAAPLAGAVQD